MYYIYILTNPKKTVLYTGVTNDLIRRISEHYYSRGTRNKFSTRFACFHLVYFEEYFYINAAIAREKEIKNWRREKKLDLIRTINPDLDLLNELLFDKWPPDG